MLGVSLSFIRFLVNISRENRFVEMDVSDN